jgi:hypothetical protein
MQSSRFGEIPLLELSAPSTPTESLSLLAARTALDKVLNRSSFFDICGVDKAMELVGSPSRRSEAYKVLHALHCVSYTDIPLVLRDQIPSLINQVLRDCQPNPAAVDACLEGVRGSEEMKVKEL